MNNIVLKIITKDGSIYSFPQCVNFTFSKEFYTPYSTATGIFLVNENTDFSPADAKRCELFLEGKLLHRGLADKTEISFGKGKNLLTFTSRSYTVFLGQNQPEPGIISDVNLNRLITNNISCPYIEYQTDTSTVNYIYVKENSTVWEAVNVYCLKAYNTRPYIRSHNTVMATSSGQNIDYSEVTITEKFHKSDTSLMLSEIYMADTSGNYTFHRSSQQAEELDIERKKYIPLDNQWLSDTAAGLEGILDFSRRKCDVTGFSYCGFRWEDLTDTVQLSDTQADGMKINAIRVKGDKSGIITTIYCYNDPYGGK